MNFRLIATFITLTALPLAALAAEDQGCAMLRSRYSGQIYRTPPA